MRSAVRRVDPPAPAAPSPGAFSFLYRDREVKCAPWCDPSRRMKLSHALAALIIAWFAVFGECCAGLKLLVVRRAAYRLTERHEGDRWVRCGVGVSFTNRVQLV